MLAKTTIIVLLALLNVSASLCFSSSNDTVYLWRGLDHQWQRKIPLLGFETPHRLGSLANYLLADSAQANVTFTPGVDGDFAHPSVDYTRVALAPGSRVRVTSSDFVLQFRDSANKTNEDGSNEARSSFRRTVVVQLTGDAAAVGDAVLRGVRVDMHCDDAAQPDGRVCNSNGVWPFRLAFGVDKCSLSSPSSSLKCELSFDLWRGWTPAFGGAKPFNFVMSYTVHFALSVVSASPADALGIARAEPVLRRSHLQADAAEHGVVNVAPPPSFNVAQGVDTLAVGLAAFSFELPETDDFKQRGRYIERIHFAVGQPQFAAPSSSANRNATYTFDMQVASPHTVFASLVDLSHRATVFFFGAAQTASIVEQSASGTVCVSSELFRCSLKALPQRTNVLLSL
jgi:hypothetical protein